MVDSVIRLNRKYYPQTLLEECKHEIKKSKMEKTINDDFDPSLPINVIMNLTMNLTMKQIMNNLLKAETRF